MKIELHRERLQELKVDALAYGAKDTGQMGGGAASAILMAAGEEILDAARDRLAESTRQIGDAVITRAFKLEVTGVRWIVHIISIIRDTPQGAWCPKPAKLEDGVYKGLCLAHEKGARSIGISMLGTNEGRVPPADAARYMISGMKRFDREFPGALEIHFSLPTPADHRAVQEFLARGY